MPQSLLTDGLLGAPGRLITSGLGAPGGGPSPQSAALPLANVFVSAASLGRSASGTASRPLSAATVFVSAFANWGPPPARRRGRIMWMRRSRRPAISHFKRKRR